MRAWRPIAAVILLTTILGGCLAQPEPDFEALEAARIAEEIEAIKMGYNETTGPLLGLDDFPPGADWVVLELVVLNATESVAVDVTIERPAAPVELAEPRCFSLFLDDVGGYFSWLRDSSVIDTTALHVAGPDAGVEAGGASARAFEEIGARDPRHVIIAVGDRDAWETDGLALDAHIASDVPVYWRLTASGPGHCLLHFDEYGDGVGARIGPVAAATDLYDTWDLDPGGMMFLVWRADVAYDIYVAYNDQYAAYHFDSETSLATEGGYGLPLSFAAKWGLYVPTFAGTSDTVIAALVLEGWQPQA